MSLDKVVDGMKIYACIPWPSEESRKSDEAPFFEFDNSEKYSKYFCRHETSSTFKDTSIVRCETFNRFFNDLCRSKDYARIP